MCEFSDTWWLDLLLLRAIGKHRVVKAFEYSMLNNRTASIIKALDRIDVMDYPEAALREALVNAVIHRDYSLSGSIIMNIYSERMESVSLGGLAPGLTIQDIKNGISLPGNPKLARVFSIEIY